MEEMLSQLGLNEKESRFYLYLLENGARTVLEIGDNLKEKRTNVYMVLKKLIEEKLVEVSSGKTKQYSAANPERLKNLLATKQQELRRNHAALSAALPELNSMYRLGSYKPGVVYLEGIRGFKTFLDDIYKTGETVHLLASDTVPEIKDAWELLENETRKRAAKDIKTKAIFHKKLKKKLDKKVLAVKGFESRFWAEQPIEGEVAIYGNKVAFTAYEPALITTIITNKVLAKTLLTVFEQIWKTAET